MSKFVHGQSVWCCNDIFSRPEEFWYDCDDMSHEWGVVKKVGSDKYISRMLKYLYASPLAASEAQARSLTAEIVKHENLVVSAKNRVVDLRETLVAVEEDLHFLRNPKNP